MATRTKLTRIEKRKRLDALFDRGSYVRFNGDSEGRVIVDPIDQKDSDVQIWVGPPSPLQREMAIREAQAGRARVMLDARDKEDSPQWLAIRGFICGLNLEALLDYIVGLDDSDYIAQARREVLVAKEWDDFNSLRDSIRQYEEAGSPIGDPEWEPLLERDRRFGEQVLSRADEFREDARAGYRLMPRVKLEEKAIDKRVEQSGSSAFMAMYEEWMLFYACRDDEDHKVLYFDNVDDLKSQPEDVQQALASRLSTYITEATEAKNSRGAGRGSASSVPPVEPEISESSTQEA